MVDGLLFRHPEYARKLRLAHQGTVLFESVQIGNIPLDKKL
jgi:hypothetical protein